MKTYLILPEHYCSKTRRFLIFVSAVIMVFGVSFLFYPRITVGRVLWNAAVGAALGLLMIAGHKRQELHFDESTITQIFPDLKRANKFVIAREKIVSIKE